MQPVQSWQTPAFDRVQLPRLAGLDSRYTVITGFMSRQSSWLVALFTVAQFSVAHISDCRFICRCGYIDCFLVAIFSYDAFFSCPIFCCPFSFAFSAAVFP